MKITIRLLGLLCCVLLLMSACAPKENLSLDTPYGTLEYPQEWSDALKTREGEEGGIFSKTFSAQFSTAQYDLFAVYFGESSRGTLNGYIFEGESRLPVYIECFLLPEGHSLTDQEAEQFYQMLDGINAVVASIQAMPGYSEGE